MPGTSPNILLIFIKNPKKGHVKTRLAATMGDDKALVAYKKLLGYTRKTVTLLQADKQLWYSRYVPEADAWNDELFHKKVQSGQTLGERMKLAFEQAFKDGYKNVVIIGSDCGQLKLSHLQQAYQELNNHDVVIGPSEDGGYYLIGMSRFLPELFEDKPWSTEDVFDQTIKDCNEHGFSHAVLEELNDVDTEADWNQVKDQF